MPPTKEDYIYAAGFVDGEGTLRISHSKAKPTTYTLKVQVVNTNKEVLDWFKEKFNGTVRMSYKASKKYKRKACWVWEISCKRAEFFIQNIILFLKVKRNQADLCIEFREHTKRYPVNRKLTKQEVAIRKNYKSRISKLNQGV